MPVFALSIHADYRCQRSGVCCTSDWDVPVEVPLFRTLGDAVSSGRLVPPGEGHEGDPPLVPGPDLPDDAGAMVARTSSGDCVFYHRGSGLCVVHRDLGEPSLPATCRHFPRIAVLDWRGTFISLSHYCPTAAGMLFREDVPLEILAEPSGFPQTDYEGLRVDADAWPPLLHPAMLMDVDAYAAWERHMVARCGDATLSPEGVIATLERDARILRTFQPASGSLVEAIGALPRSPVDAAPPSTLGGSLEMHAEVMAAVPDDLRPGADDDNLPEVYGREVLPGWAAWHRPVRHYLAAKAFANWTAYQGRGLLTVVRGLEAALALVRVEAARECRNTGRALDAELLKQAIRGADFVLNHIAAGDTLAENWSKVEDGAP